MAMSCHANHMFHFRNYQIIFGKLEEARQKVSGQISLKLNSISSDLSGRAVQGVGMRPLAVRDCGFESRRGRGGLL
jgi:hypothetical protein